jgi:hypothetical protein
VATTTRQRLRSTRRAESAARWPTGTGLQIAGAVLAILAALPMYNGLRSRPTGLAGSATVNLAAQYAELIWSGTLVIGALAVAAGLLRDDLTLRWLNRAAAQVVRVPISLYASTLALVTTVLAAWFTRAVLAGQPDLIDSFAQLTHARFLADGRLTGPASPFWHIQQTLTTSAGWVSQYPPGYAFLLAAGLKLGVVWLVGPVLAGVAVFFTALSAERLLHDDRAVARAGALLAALSPFAIAQAGSYMSHTAAAAAAALMLYGYAHGRSGGSAGFVVCGLAAGALFAIRPYTALALGLVVVGALVFDAGLHERRRPALLLLAAGAAPIALGVALYNQLLFGAPFRFGYAAALGPAGGLGFHTDPWGNTYQPVEALAYTSAELTALSLFLLESPFPLIAVMGLALVVRPRLGFARLLVVAWILVPLAANLFYWHHGLYRGPRMLADVAPAWALFAAIAFVELGRFARGRRIAQRWSLMPALAVVAALVLLIAPLALGPGRLSSYRRDALNAALLEPPHLEERALVFVHGAWTGRLAARLAAAGMRLDSVETALRQNSTCAVHDFADAYEQKRALPRLDFTPRASGFPPERLVSPGNRIRVQPGERITPHCAREINADRAGVVDVTPLVWQGALPGARNDARPMFVRDLGPERNQTLLREYPDRTAYIYGPAHPEVEPRLWPYEGAVKSLWGSHVDH